MTTELQPRVSLLTIKISGQAISRELQDALVEVEVENDIHLPDCATMRFKLGSDASIPDGVINDYLGRSTEVEIAEKDITSGSQNVIFKGEVTSISLECAAWGDDSTMIAVVQACDKSHRLHRGRKTKTHLNKTFSDIASGMASSCGLTASVESTSPTYDYVLQANQSDWEFLLHMASRVGYDVYASEGKLNFKKAQSSPGGPLSLEWGKELLQFHIRSTSSFQVPKVTVRGWDWEAKQPIVGQAQAGEGGAELGGESQKGQQLASAAYGDSTIEIVDVPVKDQADADNVAKALSNAIASGHVYAEGVTSAGMGEMLPGKQVELKKLGAYFSGKYYVTSTVHRYTAVDGYTTTFVIGGRRSNTLAELMDAGPQNGGHGQRMYGVVPAVVTNLGDDKNLGRVKVKFPWLKDGSNDIESWWARIAVTDAGPESGVEFLPEVNDEVLVAFEFGDVNRPYIIGSLWNGQSKPPVGNSTLNDNGKVKQRIIKSRSGHQIILDDTSGSEKVTVVDKTTKNKIEIDAANNTLSIAIEQDITIEAKGKVTIKSTGDMALDSGGKLDLKSTGDCTIQATGNFSAKGNNATLEANVNAEVKGNAKTSVSASGQTEIKGAMVMIN